MRAKIMLILAALSLAGFPGCSSNRSEAVQTQDPQIHKESSAEPKKVVDDDDVDDVDNVKGAFQKTGHEMEKGFKKAGSEIKDFFVGDDKDKKD